MQLYNTIKHPLTNKLYSIYSKKGKEILNNYIHAARGGAVKTVNVKGNVISSFEYFEIEAYTEYYDELQKNMLDLQKLFIQAKITQDIEIVNEVRGLINLRPDITYKCYTQHRKILNYVMSIDINNLVKIELKSTDKEKPKPIIKYYTQLFFLSIYDVFYSDPKNKSTLNITNYEYAESIGFFINKIYDLKTILKTYIYQINKPYVLDISSKLGQLQPTYGGGKDEFISIKNALEIVAEPKHDFSGKERSIVYNSFNSKYNGSVVGETVSQADYTKINSIINSGRHPFWSSRLLKHFLPNIEKYLQLSDMEPRTFQALFMLDEFNINGTNVLYHTKFKFYGFKPDESSFLEWIINKEEKSVQKEIDESFIETFHTYLKADNITNYVYDTSSGMADTSKILKYIDNPGRTRGTQIQKLIPLANLWDPGSASVPNFNENRTNASSAEEAELLEELSMDTDAKDTTDNPVVWYPKRNTLSAEYFITVDPDKTTKDPVKLSFRGLDEADAIYLSTGLSVLELYIIIDLVNNRTRTSEHIANVASTDWQKYEVAELQWPEKKNRIDLVIDGLNKYISKNSGIKNEDLIKILLDMKKTGDWGQVKWVSKYNKKNASRKKAMLISGDKLCALFSIFNDNPTLFGGTKHITTNIRGKESNEPIVLGYFRGLDVALTKKFIKSEMEYIRNLIPQFFSAEKTILNTDDLLIKFKATMPKVFESLNQTFDEIIKEDGGYYCANEKGLVSNTIQAIGITKPINILIGERGYIEIIYKFLEIVSNSSSPEIKSRGDGEKIKSYIQQYRLIIEILKNLEKFLEKNISTISDSIKTLNLGVLSALQLSCFGSKSPTLSSDLDSLLQEVFDSGNAVTREESIKKGTRLIKSIDSWTKGGDSKNAFRWATKRHSTDTIPENITNCDFFDGRLSGKTNEIIHNIQLVSHKLLKIQQVELAYKTIPNIYTNLIKSIESIKLEDKDSSTASLREMLKILQSHLTWTLMRHFTFEKAQKAFEFNKNSINGINSDEIGEENNYNIAAMTDVISNNKYFIKCLVYKLEEQAEQQANADDLNNLLDAYDNIEDLLGGHKEI